MKRKRAKTHFVLVPHTADIGLFIEGKTKKILFTNAAFGLLSILYERKKFLPKRKISIALSAENWEYLLVDWLHEILYNMTVKKLGFSDIRIKTITPFSIHAEAIGEKINPSRHEIFREIKAVTHHNLKIKKSKKGYAVTLIVDI